MTATKKRCFFAFSVLNFPEPSTTVIQSPVFTNDYKFCISVNKLRQSGVKKNQHQESHQRGTIHDKFAIFAKIGKEKSQ